MKTLNVFAHAVVALLALGAAQAFAQTFPLPQGQPIPASPDYQKGFQDGYDRAVADMRAQQGGAVQVAPQPIPLPAPPPAQVLQVPPGSRVTTSNGVTYVTPPPQPVIVAAPALRNRGIVIVRAWYGPEFSNGRNHRDGGNCDLTGRLSNQMNGQRRASIDINNQLCGDPAPGKRKTAKAIYLCGSEEREAEAYEFRPLRLSCE